MKEEPLTRFSKASPNSKENKKKAKHEKNNKRRVTQEKSKIFWSQRLSKLPQVL